MTTYYSDNADRIYDGKKALRGSGGLPVVAMMETYEASALASGSTVNMFKPSKGYKYLGIGELAWDDMGAAAATTSVGVGITAAGGAAVVAAFLAATDVQAAADKAALDAGAAAITYLGYEFDGETWVTLTTAGGNAQTGTVSLMMLFMAP
jgi:hypothetical protein